MDEDSICVLHGRKWTMFHDPPDDVLGLMGIQQYQGPL